MAMSLVVNGVSYLYPDTGDQSWGSVASAWAAAVTTGMLQKSGGAFTLTADVNFGANFGLISKYFTSQGTNPASTGVVRLSSSDALSFRNNANSADIALAKNASDQLTWAGAAFLSSAGAVLAAAMPALTGDVTTSAGTVATTVAKIQGTTVSGTTGTGNVVLSASPTFTGTIAAAALTLSTALTVANGGTGLATGTSGGILGFTATGTLASSSALTASQLIVGGGAGATPSTLAAGSQYQVLVMGATTPGYGAVNLAQSAAVTGILPNANTTATNAATASSIVSRDASANARINNLIEGFTSITSAAGTTTLTVASTYCQQVTGSTTQTIVLPDCTTLVVGHQFLIQNRSSGVVTVNANGGGLIQTMPANSQTLLTCLSVGTSAGTWDTQQSTNNAGGGTVTSVTFTGDGTVLSSTPSSAVTTSGTLTAALNTQAKNTIFAGPSSGANAAPTFRSQVYADVSPVFKIPTFQRFLSTGTTTGYLFTISTSTTCAVGDTYTNNGNTYTVLAALSAQTGQVLFTSGSSAPTASGTLTRATGAGTASVTFSANTPLATYTVPASPPIFIKIRTLGAGGGGGGSNASGAAGAAGGTSTFGPNMIIANGGTGGGGGSTSTPAGGAGGTASVASPATIIATAQGGGGGTGLSETGANVYPAGGIGGSSYFGGGGWSAATNAGGAGAANTGGGGAGAGWTTQGIVAGAGGGAGGYAEAIVANPTGGATYPYCVGVGGIGGTGTGGAAGAAGGSGIVIVEEYYQ